jgi:Ser/Thr protein kinase RdoA (MazF antagonist)
VSEAVECWAALPGSATSYLAHGDLDSTHLYVDPASARKTFTGIIDFGEIRGADPLYDLGHLLLHDGEGGRPVLLPHLLAGYAQVTPLPDDATDAIRLQALAIGARARHPARPRPDPLPRLAGAPAHRAHISERMTMPEMRLAAPFLGRRPDRTRDASRPRRTSFDVGQQ